ncbi:MAG: glycosyltransferase 87 family protein [Nocardioidaceae bacterium]
MAADPLGVVRPSRTDPFLTAASEGVGGPVGDHAAPHPWWTPVRVVLAVTVLAFVLGMAQKTPCVRDGWVSNDVRYGAMCYSDLPYLYTGRGLAAGFVPYADNGGRYSAMEYPVLTGYFAYGAARLTQLLSGSPDLAARQRLDGDQINGAVGVRGESSRYFVVSAVLLAPFALLTAWLLAGVHRRRPWDAMLFAASPALVLAGLVNWDLLAVTAVAGALWAWSRGRPVLAGVAVGLGTAAKLYPLFLLGALLVVCLRRRRLRAFGVTLGAAVAAWLVVDLPALLTGFEEWKVFWTFNSDRGADLGSLWLVASQTGHSFTPDRINQVSTGVFLAVCLGVLALGLRAPRPPRIPQLAYLVVAGFLVVNKVYSPQYVLWLLPLVVLARPRWRDVLIWTAGEVFYFAAVWFYLGGWTASSVAGGVPDRFYLVAIVVRVTVELYLAAVVVRDVLDPWHDPVRADGLTDDPAEPVPPPG